MRPAVVVALVVLAGCDRTEARQRPAPAVRAAPLPPAPAAPPAEQVRAVEATALLAQYRANEVGADYAWKGKLAQVTGVLGSIQKDFLDAPFVTLAENSGDLNTVQCALAPGQDGHVARLSKGQRATFRGRVTGMTLGSVFADDCVYVPPAARSAPAAPRHR